MNSNGKVAELRQAIIDLGTLSEITSLSKEALDALNSINTYALARIGSTVEMLETMGVDADDEQCLSIFTHYFVSIDQVVELSGHAILAWLQEASTQAIKKKGA